jgi:uncharacterized protein with GYD domain
MPKFMIAGSYTADGAKGLLKDGGSARKAAVEKALNSLGGKLECFYFAFGATDAFAIVDVPDNVSAAAIALATSASGLVRTTTTVLLTPEEMDAVVKKGVKYSPPGQ